MSIKKKVILKSQIRILIKTLKFRVQFPEFGELFQMYDKKKGITCCKFSDDAYAKGLALIERYSDRVKEFYGVNMLEIYPDGKLKQI